MVMKIRRTSYGAALAHLQFKTTPRPHQLEELENTKDKEFFAYFHEMGLGKTKLALDLAAYLFNCRHIKQVLFITKNGVDQQTVEDEVPLHLPLLEGEYLADYWRGSNAKWPKFRKYQHSLDDKLVILAINCEALGTKIGIGICKKLAQRAPTLLVIDESQEFKSMSSLRTKNLLSISKLFPFRRIMTGTPTGGNPVDLYSQMTMLSDSIMPRSIFAFEATYCVKQKSNIWIKCKKTGTPIRKNISTTVGYKNLDKLEELIAPFVSRRTKADCAASLPPKLYTTFVFELSDQERALYNRVKNSVLAEVAPGKYVDTTMAVTKLLRLQQVACGFVSYEDLVTGERAKDILPNPSRMKALKECLNLTVGKTIIWSRFTTSIDQIMEMLIKEFGSSSVVRYDGSVTDAQKQLNKVAFKTDVRVRFLVGHPKSGGVGLNLPEATTTIYYSNDHSLITRLQSEDRMHRLTSTEAVTYVDLVGSNTVDVKIVKALKDRFDIASQLTGDELREWIK